MKLNSKDIILMIKDIDTLSHQDLGNELKELIVETGTKYLYILK